MTDTKRLNALFPFVRKAFPKDQIPDIREAAEPLWVVVDAADDPALRMLDECVAIVYERDEVELALLLAALLFGDEERAATVDPTMFPDFDQRLDSD